MILKASRSQRKVVTGKRIIRAALDMILQGEESWEFRKLKGKMNNTVSKYCGHSLSTMCSTLKKIPETAKA